MQTIAAALLLLAGLAFAQAPAPRPQPDALSYGLKELEVFTTYTRDSYREKFGPAPACDPARPLKGWFDLTPGASTYKSLGGGATAAMQTMTMPKAWASTVNLPGRETFPRYVPAPNRATSGGATLGANYADMLSTREQADRFAAMMGGKVEMLQLPAAFPWIYPADETRRPWLVRAGGQTYFAGQLLRFENSAGVGHPGKWGIGEAGWEWTPEVIPDCAGKTDWVPTPVRELLENEKFSGGLMGLAIVRTDRVPPAQNPPANGIELTAEDRARLVRIDETLRALAGLFGIK